MHDITYQLFVKKPESVINIISLVFSNFPQAWEIVIIITIFNTFLLIKTTDSFLFYKTHLDLSFYLPFCETDTIMIQFFKWENFQRSL